VLPSYSNQLLVVVVHIELLTSNPTILTNGDQLDWIVDICIILFFCCVACMCVHSLCWIYSCTAITIILLCQTFNLEYFSWHLTNQHTFSVYFRFQLKHFYFSHYWYTERIQAYFVVNVLYKLLTYLSMIYGWQFITWQILLILCCDKIMDRMTSTIRPKARIEDMRKCVLCHVHGDAPTEGPGR